MAIEERTGRTEVIKVLSHVDIEQEKAEEAREKKRQRKEEEERTRQSGKVPRKVPPPKNQR